MAAEVSYPSAEIRVLTSWYYKAQSMVLHSKAHTAHGASALSPQRPGQCTLQTGVAWQATFLSSLPPQPSTQHTKHLTIHFFHPQHSCYHSQGLVCTVDSVLCHDINLIPARCSKWSGCSWHIWCVCVTVANTAPFLESEKAQCARGEDCSSTVCCFWRFSLKSG